MSRKWLDQTLESKKCSLQHLQKSFLLQVKILYSLTKCAVKISMWLQKTRFWKIKDKNQKNKNMTTSGNVRGNHKKKFGVITMKTRKCSIISSISVRRYIKYVRRNRDWPLSHENGIDKIEIWKNQIFFDMMTWTFSIFLNGICL